MEARREQILAIIKTDMQAMTVVNDGILWSVVRRSPLTSIDRRKSNALSVMVAGEDKEKLLGKYDCKLHVRFRFYLLVAKASDPDSELTKVLGHIHKRVHAQVLAAGVLDGLAWNVDEMKNDLDVENSTDRQVEGDAVYTYAYRHKLGDQTLAR